MTELGLKDPSGWDAPELQGLPPEQAAQKIMEMYPDHPLYGMNPAIPVHVYAGAGHGFNCDARGDFRPDAAGLALERTLALFSQTLDPA